MICVVFLLCMLFSDIDQVLGESKSGPSCTENSIIGYCTPLAECASAKENLNRKIFPHICGFERLVVIVCCITPPVNASIDNDEEEEVKIKFTNKIKVFNNSTRVSGEISKAKCREYAKHSYREESTPLLSIKPQFHKIYHCNVKGEGEVLTIGKHGVSRKEIAHMALIGFHNVGPLKKINYLCGGSLISENFVLTSSSCYDYYLVPPHVVLFGVNDIHATEHRQEIKIEEFFVHPDYSNETGYHDVGLIKLEKPVDINPYVRPACLNTVKDINYNTAVVFEWGLKHFFGETSSDVLKSILNIIPNKRCQESVDALGETKQKVENDLMICATIISNQRNDPCENAVGGSLQVLNQNSEEFRCTSLIIGVTSSIVYCGVEQPEIFSRVSEEIDWIEQIVWPELL